MPHRASDAANPQVQPHHRAAASADPSHRQNAGGKAVLEPHEAADAQLREGQGGGVPNLVQQATALEEAAAMHDSAQDSEWLAIAENIPDGKQMQARADDEV